MFEGVPNYPDASRFWQVVEKHKVNIFYTAPTAIRALMGEGDECVEEDHRARRCACSARSASRSIPRPGCGTTSVVGEEPLPDRRHLVADRDRRHHDHAAARRDPT